MLNQLEFTNGMQMPIGAMYGVGQNYAAHAKEMGGQEYSMPILFIKPPSAYIPSGSVFKYQIILIIFIMNVNLLLLLEKNVLT
jgi:2-keto-4-pentenoate hydratase/2-oxohepta-3-ene-1,7-dioic acid hydratase in catechol pathway